MGCYFLVPLGAFLVDAFTWTYVFAQGTRSPVNRAYLVFSGVISLWLALNFVLWLPLSDEAAMALIKFNPPVWLQIGFLFLNFIYVFLDRRRDTVYRFFAILTYAAVVVSYFTDLIVDDFVRFYWGPGQTSGPLFIPATLLVVGLPTFYGVVLIYLAARRSGGRRQRNQLNLVIVGAVVSMLIGLFSDVLLTNVFEIHDYVPLGSSSSVILSLFTFLAVVRYRFLSVTVQDAANDLFANLQDGVVITDLGRRAVQMNRAALEVFGFTTSFDYSGLPVAQLFPGYSLDEISRGGEVTIGPPWRERIVSLSQSPVTDGDRDLGFILILRDITDRKRAENDLLRHRMHLEELVEERTREITEAHERLQKEIAEREQMEQELLKANKLESIGVLAGGIAHDFNNILSIIWCNVSLARKLLKTGGAADDRLSDADRAIRRARELTQQLLTFAKGGAPVKRAASIAEVLRESAELALRGSNVSLELIEPTASWPVDVDEGQMNQVFNNLLINADQAMPDGGRIKAFVENVVVEKGSGIPVPSGSYVRVRLQDEGIGIPKENIPRIFDPYFTTKERGTGLGLATTYSIIRRHNGHILVDSEVGVGTTFSIYLPASASSIEPLDPGRSVQLSGRGRVLVVDDEPELRSAVAKMLASAGFEVAVAADGAEALSVYSREKQAGNRFEAVIMDLTIRGGMGGREAARRLLEIDPDAKLIASSGYSDDPVMSTYEEYGFGAVLTKPYTFEEMAAALARVVRK